MYGLRNAPRAWYKRVRTDLESLGWRAHQLDQCVFLKYEGEQLIGACGVYVDDFILAGKKNDPRWKAAKASLVGLYKWGSGKPTHLLCVVYAISKRVISPL